MVEDGGPRRVVTALNPLGQMVQEWLIARHPEWAAWAEAREGGDLEVAVPAPKGSRAKRLIISTHPEGVVWVRFAAPRMCYPVDSEHDLHRVVGALLSDRAFFLVVTNGDEWVETSLLPPGQEPVLREGQTATVVSWSGNHDRITMWRRDPEMRTGTRADQKAD